MKHYIDSNNYIKYEIFDDVAFIRWLFYDDINLLSNNVRSYIDFLSTIDNAEFLGWYPGTFNPLVVKYVLDYVKNNNFKCRIFYDLEEVPNIKAFENSILRPSVEMALSIESETITSSSCDGTIGKFCKANGFKKCCVFTPLKKNYDIVKVPIKYYEIDDDGFLINEYLEKPKNNKNYYQSFRIGHLFKSMKIKIENGKPIYYKK